MRPATCTGLFFSGAACARGRVRAEVEPRSARAPSVEKSSTHSPSTTDSSKHTESPAARERASWVSENVVGAWTRPAAPSLAHHGGFWPAEGSHAPHVPGDFGRRVRCTDKQGGAASLAPPNSKVNKGSGNNSFGLQIFVVPPAHRGVRPLCLRVLQKETLHLTFHVNFCLGGGSAQRT